jgi:hypothetical protein
MTADNEAGSTATGTVAAKGQGRPAASASSDSSTSASKAPEQPPAGGYTAEEAALLSAAAPTPMRVVTPAEQERIDADLVRHGIKKPSQQG